MDRRLFGLALEGSAALFLDAFRKELYTGFRRKFQLVRQLVDPTLTLGSRPKTFAGSMPTATSSMSWRPARRSASPASSASLPRGWELALGAHGHAWDEPGAGRSLDAGRGGRAIGPAATGAEVVRAEAVWTGVYRRAQVDAEFFARFGDVRFMPAGRLGWGEDLPIQLAFPLGGDDGFPGLHIGERRGDREAMLGLMLHRAGEGPAARPGRVGGRAHRRSAARCWEDGWVGGIRAGLGADTPVGPVRFEYGYSTEERGAVFVRLGEWS